MSKEMLDLADRIDGPLPQLVTDVDKNEKSDSYRLILSSSERHLLSALLRASVGAAAAPTKPDGCEPCRWPECGCQGPEAAPTREEIAKIVYQAIRGAADPSTYGADHAAKMNESTAFKAADAILALKTSPTK